MEAPLYHQRNNALVKRLNSKYMELPLTAWSENNNNNEKKLGNLRNNSKAGTGNICLCLLVEVNCYL